MKNALLFLLATAATANADFIVPTPATLGWKRPTAPNGQSTFQAWEYFNSPTGPNPPQSVFGSGDGNPAAVTYAPPASDFHGFGGASAASWSTVNAQGTANVFDTLPNSFITSGGNIYSFSGGVNPRITVPNNLDATPGNNPSGRTVLLLQIRLQGGDLNPQSLKVTTGPGSPEFAPQGFALLATQTLGGFGGTLRDYAVKFSVPGNADLYTIDFSSLGSSMSLDRVAVDTHWSPRNRPEPNDAVWFAPVSEPMLGMLALAFALTIIRKGVFR